MDTSAQEVSVLILLILSAKQGLYSFTVLFFLFLLPFICLRLFNVLLTLFQIFFSVFAFFVQLLFLSLFFGLLKLFIKGSQIFLLHSYWLIERDNISLFIKGSATAYACIRKFKFLSCLLRKYAATLPNHKEWMKSIQLNTAYGAYYDISVIIMILREFSLKFLNILKFPDVSESLGHVLLN
jgi:hypothetical protein